MLLTRSYLLDIVTTSPALTIGFLTIYNFINYLLAIAKCLCYIAKTGVKLVISAFLVFYFLVLFVGNIIKHMIKTEQDVQQKCNKITKKNQNNHQKIHNGNYDKQQQKINPRLTFQPRVFSSQINHHLLQQQLSLQQLRQN